MLFRFGEFILVAKSLQMPEETILEACRTASKGAYLSHSVTLSLFTSFPCLLLELRYKIWTKAHPRPQTLFIKRNSKDSQQALDQHSLFGHLLVSCEAQDAFLECYRQIFPAY